MIGFFQLPSLFATDGEDDIYADIQTAATLGLAGP